MRFLGLGTQKAPEAVRPLPLLYSSASDFQFRYAPVTVILGYKNQRDAWWQNKSPRCTRHRGL